MPGGYVLYSGKFYYGGQKIAADGPFERMLLFVKESSIIPTGPELQYTSQIPADPVTLFVYTGKDADFTLYEDDDTTYNYEKGAFSDIEFSYSELKKKLTIAETKGRFPGMLTNRTFKIVWVTKTQPKELQFENVAGDVINYKGKELSVSIKSK